MNPTWRTAAAVVVTVAALATGCSEADDPAPTDPAHATDVETSTPAAPTRTGPTRTEYWHDLAVDVPAGWGWGSTPGSLQDWCGGPGSLAGPASGDPSDRNAPYVGRPIATTDLCTGDPGERPTAPYVWIGSPLPVGTEDLGDGWMRETVAAAGERLSVAAQDADLVAAVVSSAREADDGPCGATPEEPAAPGAVCAYRRDHGVRLLFATTIGTGALDRARDAVAEAGPPPAPPKPGLGMPCLGYETVTVTLPAGTHPDRLVYDLGCDLDVDGHAVTRATVAPWAGTWTHAVVIGMHEHLPWSRDYFIGPLG